MRGETINIFASNKQIDAAFQSWLFELAKKWDWTPQYTADHLDDEYREIRNRVTWYPKLALLLRRNDWTISRFKEIASNCYTLNGRYDAIPLNQMLNHEEEAWQAIENLVRPFPQDSNEVIKCINGFITLAVELGYTTSRQTAEYARAASLASVLLSALYPREYSKL